MAGFGNMMAGVGSRAATDLMSPRQGMSNSQMLGLAQETIQGVLSGIGQQRNLREQAKDAGRDEKQILRSARQQISTMLEGERLVAAQRRASYGAAGVSNTGSARVVASQAASVSSRQAGRIEAAAQRQANAARRAKRRAREAAKVNRVVGGVQAAIGAGMLIMGNPMGIAPLTGGAAKVVG